MGHWRRATRNEGEHPANGLVSVLSSQPCSCRNASSDRFVINDTFCSQLCLLYPPHLIAIAAIYLSLVLHDSARTILNQSAPPSQKTTPQPRRSSRQASHAGLEAAKKPNQDPISFLSELNVSLPLIATITQEIISMYALWERYQEGPSFDCAKSTLANKQATSPFGTNRSGSASLKRSASASVSAQGSTKSRSNTATPVEVAEETGGGLGPNTTNVVVTPTFLAGVLMRMRESKWVDMAHSANVRSVAVNKVLERTQAAG